jgi:hypothetical protein
MHIVYPRSVQHPRAYDDSNLFNRSYFEISNPCLGLTGPKDTPKQHHYINDLLPSFAFVVLPLSENIGQRALIYIEEYTLSRGLTAGDAIVAATAVENNMTPQNCRKSGEKFG